MTTTVIMVGSTGIIEISPLTREFIDSLSEMIGDEPKMSKKISIKKVLTEAEKQVIRDRFAAGKAKAALARGEAVTPAKSVKVVATSKPIVVEPVKDKVDFKLDPKVVPVVAADPAISVAKPKPSSVKPSNTVPVDLTLKAPAIPITRTGHKVDAKPASQ